MNGGTQSGSVLPTGITYLDDLLYGGLPIGGLTLVTGQSGAGKSMLAHQLCRSHPTASRFVLCDGVPPEAVASRHVEPRPRYHDVTHTLHEPTLDPLFAELEACYGGGDVSLMVFDSLDNLLNAPGRAPLRIVSRLCELTWRAHVATVLCCSLQFHSGHPLTASTALYLELFRGDGVRSRRLVVHKLEGRPFRGGDHSFTLGPLGVAFDAAPKLLPTEVPVSSLGTRILTAFRTTRRSSPTELATMLGHDQDAVVATLDELTKQGFLSAEHTNDGQVFYVVPRGS